LTVNILDADRVLVAAHVDDAIDHEEGIAMRQQPQDVANSGRAKAFPGKGVPRHAPSLSGLPALRTRRTQDRHTLHEVAHRLRGRAHPARSRGHVGHMTALRTEHCSGSDADVVGEAHLTSHHDEISHLGTP
jgi:hypothetical protein